MARSRDDHHERRRGQHAVSSEDVTAKAESSTASEFGLIDWIRRNQPRPPADLAAGIGEDCAVWNHGGDAVLLKVDSLVEGRHFQRRDPGAPGHATPEQIGRKALARAVSDIAAMGGIPRFALVAAVLPQGAGPALREGITHGLTGAGQAFGVALIGGDTTATAADHSVVLGVTVIGEMKGVKPVLRRGARAGDAVYVTGKLGGSIVDRHLTFVPRLAEGRWLAEFGISAMLDVSDGLAQDLWQLTRESKVGAVIGFDQIPVSEDALESGGGDSVAARWAALTDGEDYELLFTVDEFRAADLDRAWPFSTPLTRIGQVTPLRKGEAPGEGNWIEVGGEMRRLERLGYEHQL